MNTADFPTGPTPEPLSYLHFPSRISLFIWRNWEFFDAARLAEVLGTDAGSVTSLAKTMGLPEITCRYPDWSKNGYNSVIRANWHILPYEQLLKLLDWQAEKLAYVLKEDDMLFMKLGALKPACKPLLWEPPSDEILARCRAIGETVRKSFPDGVLYGRDPFDFDCPENRKKFPAVNDAVGENEIILTGKWSVEFPANLPENSYIPQFVRDFQNDFEKRFTPDAASEKCIRIILHIQNGQNLPKESHTVDIRQDAVEITAVDERGILQALHFLYHLMEQKQAPILSCRKHIRTTGIEHRLIYPQDVPYAAPFDRPDTEICPDELLKKFSYDGINGIWLPGLLYQLTPWEIDPELSANWQERIGNLRRLTRRAARYGIGVYLYMSEPRCLPYSFFERHPELLGFKLPSYFCNVGTLCTSVPEVKDFIRNGMAELFTSVPELEGVFTISASENPTNCYSKYVGDWCPRCAERSAEDVISEVNSLIEAGIHSVKPDAVVFVWSWGWRSDWENPQAPFNDWAPGIIDKLPDNIRLLCTSEESIPMVYGDTTMPLRDYSLSHPGPSARTYANWSRAARRGILAAAKIQINNSWEISSVPYIPVMNLLNEHFRNLMEADVRDIMVSWTVGGFPETPNLKLFSRYIWKEKGQDISLRQFAAELYGEKFSVPVSTAWKIISDAFRKYPHLLSVLYRSPVHMGAANLLFDYESDYRATMITFPYNCSKAWYSPLTEEQFLTHFKVLSKEWIEATETLKQAVDQSEINEPLKELIRIMETIGSHFKSTCLQTRFISLRQHLATSADAENDRAEMIGTLKEETALAVKIHRLACEDARIGFEPAQHYFFRPLDLVEKVINCKYIINRLSNNTK